MRKKKNEKEKEKTVGEKREWAIGIPDVTYERRSARTVCNVGPVASPIDQAPPLSAIVQDVAF